MIRDVCGVSSPLRQPEVLVLGLHHVDEYAGEDGQTGRGEADPALPVVQALDGPPGGAGRGGRHAGVDWGCSEGGRAGRSRRGRPGRGPSLHLLRPRCRRSSSVGIGWPPGQAIGLGEPFDSRPGLRPGHHGSARLRGSEHQLRPKFVSRRDDPVRRGQAARHRAQGWRAARRRLGDGFRLLHLELEVMDTATAATQPLVRRVGESVGRRGRHQLGATGDRPNGDPSTGGPAASLRRPCRPRAAPRRAWRPARGQRRHAPPDGRRRGGPGPVRPAGSPPVRRVVTRAGGWSTHEGPRPSAPPRRSPPWDGGRPPSTRDRLRLMPIGSNPAARARSMASDRSGTLKVRWWGPGSAVLAGSAGGSR